jgi:hypothetical protein
MQEKTITIPFDRDEFLKSQKIIWLFSFKKIIKSYLLYTIAPIIILTLEYTSEIKEPFSLGLFIGWGLLIYASLKWNEFFQKRKAFFKRAEIFANRYAQESIDCTFTFSKNVIQYEDNEKLYKLNWSLFDPYITFRNSILLIAKDMDSIMFTIGKNEVGNENYSEICDFLKDKIGFDKVIK